MLNLKLDFTIQTETHFQKSDFIRIPNQILAIHLWCIKHALLLNTLFRLQKALNGFQSHLKKSLLPV